MPRYNHTAVEKKWQDFWEQNKTFAAPRLPQGEKLYVLDMFPYPSGDGLHVGHPEGYTATDIVSRCARMKGVSVLHPMGFDAFGLPAEEHAIKTNTPPRVQTEKNIDTFRRQLKMLGFSYDWDRELATTDVEYFRWTQWIFLQIYDTWFDTELQKGRPIAELPIPDDVRAAGDDAIRRYQDEHRLAYQSEAPVNWCPELGTVLANEEVIDGKSERGGHPVVRMPLRQWMLRITAYADRLEKDLDDLDWTESIKTLQRNWIGRSTGAEVDFYIGSGATGSTSEKGVAGTGRASGTQAGFETWKAARQKLGCPKKPSDDVLRIYTTRPDTLFGATYMVIAPEHPFVERLTTPEHAAAVKTYCEEAARKSDLDRTELAKEKTGVFTGSYAVNPVNGEQVPIWIADYVLISYGTGAIMAVPAHDTRDFEFAKQFEIPIVAVVEPGEDEDVDRAAVLAGKECFVGNGTAVNSAQYDGLPTAEFKKNIIADLAAQGLGREAVNYKLRDWLFSRQRFWGEPFPVLHELDEDGKPTGHVRAVPEDELPVNLPHLDDFKPHGRPEPPLDKAPNDWLYATIDGARYKRETNTMPQWAGSCWYYLRFLDPTNNGALVDPEIEKAWMPVDLYIGGAEHAVLHLLYARFWHKVLYDRGVVSTPEPFRKLVNQGMILGEVEFTSYQDDAGAWISASRVKKGEDGKPQTKEGNAVTPVRVKPDDCEKKGENFVLKSDPSIRLDSRAYKMSKSRGNVHNPDEIVREYGADALRLYEMFMGPLTATKPWSMEGVNGVRGFLDRVWRMIVDEPGEKLQLNVAVKDVEPTEEQNRVVHRTIKAVTEDIETLDFNTAIARMMEFTNFFLKQDTRPRAAMQQFVLILSPMAPHLCEELWRLLGGSETLAYEPWPGFEDELIREDTVEIPVQIDGKVRSRVRIPANADKATMINVARSDRKIAEMLKRYAILSDIAVPKKLVNFVALNPVRDFEKVASQFHSSYSKYAAVFSQIQQSTSTVASLSDRLYKQLTSDEKLLVKALGMLAKAALPDNISDKYRDITLANEKLTKLVAHVSVENSPLSKIFAEHNALRASLGELASDSSVARALTALDTTRLLNVSLTAQHRLVALEGKRVGTLLNADATLSNSIASNLARFTRSYKDLIEAVEQSQAVEAEIPFITKFSPVEYARELDVLEQISVPERSDVSECVADTDSLGEAQSIDVELAAHDAKLLALLRGARGALHSENPDRIRHVMASVRELFTQVIHGLAPDDQVRKWTSEKAHYHDGRPTRRARLLYVCRHIACEPLAEFVDHDVRSALTLVDALHSGTHIVESKLTEDQLTAIVHRMECLVLYLLKLSHRS